MNKIDEILNSIKERFRNPLIGSFIFAWTAANHRILMVIFGGESTSEKFRLLDALAAERGALWYPWLTAFPLLAAAAYAWILGPLAALFSDRIATWQDIKQSHQRNKQKKQQVLSLEDSNDLRNKLGMEIKLYQQQIEALKARDINQSARVSGSLRELFQAIQPILNDNALGILNRHQEFVRIEDVRDRLDARDPIHKFLLERGIPRTWNHVINIRMTHLQPRDAAEHLEIHTTKALSTLAELTTAGLYIPEILAGELIFKQNQESSLSVLFPTGA